MIILVYHFFIFCYTIIIKIAAAFNPKAGAWVNGRQGILRKIEKDLKEVDKTIWIHCASLGEFEQGRPVIEKIRNNYPDEIIVLTFFSPSGYEIRKNYSEVDFVYYLPADTIGKAKLFIKILNPKLIIFVKYEFWFGYLNEIIKRNIPAYLISAKFRTNHFLFKWHGQAFLKSLRAFSTIFVQDHLSSDLLKKKNFKPIITGDTRFDRVKSIANSNEKLPNIDKFTKGKFIIIGGSTWPEEEKILASWYKNHKDEAKLIIAPHDVSSNHISNILNLFEEKAILYSSLDSQNINDANVLVIDCIGILSQLYQYASLAVIGGGFGNGIHNTQEAIVYGLPVLFGPKYHKFQEAVDLIEEKGAFTFKSNNEFDDLMRKLLNNKELYNHACFTAKAYVEKNLGATEIVMNEINNILN